MKTNIKLRVTPKQSEAVQKICFANGIFWKQTHFNKDTSDVRYLFINQFDLTKCPLTADSYFKAHSYSEVDADLFIRTNGICEESVELVNNLLNSKSKEDMFKQYGFEVPDFDCTILTKVNNDYIGYATIPSSTIVALSWALNGIAYMGVTNTPQYNLTPIKKPWYETCKFPVLAKNILRNEELVIITGYKENYLLSTYYQIKPESVIPLTNNEIDQLKQDF